MWLGLSICSMLDYVQGDKVWSETEHVSYLTVSYPQNTSHFLGLNFFYQFTRCTFQYVTTKWSPLLVEPICHLMLGWITFGSIVYLHIVIKGSGNYYSGFQLLVGQSFCLIHSSEFSGSSDVVWWNLHMSNAFGTKLFSPPAWMVVRCCAFNTGIRSH
jgi:hypothetical protein